MIVIKVKRNVLFRRGEDDSQGETYKTSRLNNAPGEDKTPTENSFNGNIFAENSFRGKQLLRYC